MKKVGFIFLFVVLVLMTGFHLLKKPGLQIDKSKIISYSINPAKQHLQFYWKDKEDINYKNFENLKQSATEENKTLVFAMNGGMFNKDLSPQGLYIEKGIVKSEIDTSKNKYGNFYMHPNGIFYLTNSKQAVICKTEDFSLTENIEYATQSGPMLLINGEIHHKFREGSANLHIRNGVGILPNGALLFAMSKTPINFFDFATYFKQNGCKNALYLDGFVSRTYLPSKNWQQLDGNFGVIIAEIK